MIFRLLGTMNLCKMNIVTIIYSPLYKHKTHNTSDIKTFLMFFNKHISIRAPTAAHNKSKLYFISCQVFSSSCDQDKKKKKATEVTRGGEAV